jgi:hypothetical protein
LGWQQRDWAKLDDGELEELYGVQPRVGIHRGAFWAVIVSLLLTVLGVGWALRPQPASLSGVGITPSALYGMVIPEGSSLGPPGVCQELELAAGAWRCDDIAVNLANVPVIGATPYNGPCTHLQVVGTRWACLTATP